MGSEDQLVERTGRVIPSGRSGGSAGGLLLGIGDDAALISPSGKHDWVLTCDQFLEGVHFLAGSHPPDSVGYKALVRAASDVAAMGGRPRFFLMALALPSSKTGVWFDEFIRGMSRAARSMGIVLAGGDTSRSPRVSISITVLGEVAPGKALTRAGARPGDIIYVGGRLGGAQLGLELIRHGMGRVPRLRRLLRPHLYPRIQLELGAWLARHRIPSAMMDISDGLSTDLARLCGASKAGARVGAGRIPRVSIPAAISKHLRRLRLDSLKMALHGGDDYELLFTVPPRHLKRLRGAPGFRGLAAIGEITRARRILLVGEDGAAKPLQPRGWDPFRRKS
ncbi:MAG: thiamine-phosphate kinase [Candidatus Acidiferrales bacterium]